MTEHEHDPHAIAIHESGHALVGVLLGLPVGAVVLDGGTSHVEMPPAFSSDPALIERHILARLAGPAATRALTPGESRYQNDLGELVDMTGDLAERLVGALSATAMRMVGDHADVVVAMAAALEERGTLSRPEVDELIELTIKARPARTDGATTSEAAYGP